VPVPPIEITLLAQPWDSDEKTPHVFRCKPRMSAGQQFTVSRWNQADRVPTAEIERFMSTCLMKDERQRWNDLLNGEDGYVDTADLTNTWSELMGRYSGSPPPSPSASGPGPADGETTSADAPSATTSTSTD
jgi:hypothetical protein